MQLENSGCYWVKYAQSKCGVCSRNKVEFRAHSQCSHCKGFLCGIEKRNNFTVFQ